MGQQPVEVTLTADQLQQLLEKVVEAAVKAAREPDELTKQKMVEDKERRERLMKEAVELAKAEDEAKRLRWKSCSHRKPDGRAAIGGQIHSDGLIHPICLICQFPFPAIKPTPDQIVQGVQF